MKNYRPVANVPTRGFVSKAVEALAAGGAAAAIRVRENRDELRERTDRRRALKHLKELPEYLLRDIGLTAGDLNGCSWVRRID